MKHHSSRIEPDKGLSFSGTDTPDPVWIRPKALATRWGCSVSQVHRLAAKHSVRRCLLGGTGIKGDAAQNAMVLLSMEDILRLEREATV